VSLLWPHRVVVSSPGGGSAGAFNEDDEWVPDAGEDPDVLYAGAANVQDKGRVMKRDEAGTPVEVSDATCFLKKKKQAGHIPEGASVTIDWKDGTTSDAVVIGIRHSDNSLDLRRV
jgi:hypothetical protein